MHPRTPPTSPPVKTRLSCERTGGYNVKPGTHYYEWCPFCGHRVDGDTGHDLLVEVQQ